MIIYNDTPAFPQARRDPAGVDVSRFHGFRAAARADTQVRAFARLMGKRHFLAEVRRGNSARVYNVFPFTAVA